MPNPLMQLLARFNPFKELQEDYPEQEIVKLTTSPKEGIVKSPHTRKSHMRLQRCGPGYSKIRKIKVKPASIHGG